MLKSQRRFDSFRLHPFIWLCLFFNFTSIIFSLKPIIDTYNNTYMYKNYTGIWYTILSIDGIIIVGNFILLYWLIRKKK